MSLDPSKLENVRQSRGKTVARCPACAEDEHDSKGEHLVIMADERFGCIVHPGDAGKAHRRRILELAGDEKSRLQGSVRIRVRRPAHVTSPREEAVVVDLGCLGRVEAATAPGAGTDSEAELKEDAPVLDKAGRPGRVISTLALREEKKISDDREDIDNTHTHGSWEDPSGPSGDPPNNAPVNSNTRQSRDWLLDISFWPSSDRNGGAVVTIPPGLDQQAKDAADQAEEMQRALELDDRHAAVICPLSGDFFDPNAKLAHHQQLAWNTIRKTRRIKWTLFTNYPRAITRQVPSDWGANGFDNVGIGVTLSADVEVATNRVAQLRKVPCCWRAVLVDPAEIALDLDVELEGIDWVVVAGGTTTEIDTLADEWLTCLKSKCRESGTAFFRPGHHQGGDQNDAPAPRLYPFDAHFAPDCPPMTPAAANELAG